MRLFARLAIAAASAIALTAGALTTAVMAQEPQQQPQQQSGQPPLPQQPEAPVARLQASSGAKLRALDKITGNSTDISAQVGQTVAHGRIKVTVRACYQSSPQDAPESAAFLEIYAVPKAGHEAEAKQVANTPNAPMHKGPEPIGPDGLLFSGWMYASSPGLNGLEHPTYDVWVISCTTSAPQ
jgi:hypothetical protein